MAIGITYAYFTADITGKETASTVVVTGGIMQIEYSENSNVILMENIYPRTDAWVTKTITITGTNTTDLQMKYDLGLNVINNTFGHYLSYDLTLLEGDNGTPIANVTNKALVGTGYKRFGIGVFNNANSEVHKYELKIYFKDNGKAQNDAQEATFNAKVIIDESGINDPNEEITMFLTGEEVNIKMKNLANKANNDETVVSAATTANTTITSIQKSNTLKEGLTEDNIVSTATSQNPIYMWYENGTIYWWSEEKHPKLNPTSYSMFDSMRNLSDISGLSNWDSSTSTDMRYFLFDTKITNVNELGNWDTSNVTDMSLMFNNTSLTSLEGLENWDTSNVTDMAHMFFQNTSLTSLEGLENWDTSNVTRMQYMFGSDTKITDLDALSAWDTSSVIYMQDMFNGCNKVKEADIGNWDLSKLSRTKNANIFPGCSGLERLKTPKVYPTASGVKINLPVTLKDSLGTSYTSLGTGSPTSTWLTK